MNNKYLAPLVCGFGAAVLSVVPGIKNFGCCLILPLAAGLSIYLYLKITGDLAPVKISTALLFGLLTGISAAFFATTFDVLFTFALKSNDFILSLPESETLLKEFELGALLDETFKLLRNIENEIRATGFSFLYTVLVLISNLIIDSIFGMLGGLLGMTIINRRS